MKSTSRKVTPKPQRTEGRRQLNGQSNRKNLKVRAHKLHPVVLIGSKGLTDNVTAETDLTLQAHELIKVRISGMERDERKACLQKLAESVGADIIQTIGNVVVLYRANPEKG